MEWILSAQFTADAIRGFMLAGSGVYRLKRQVVYRLISRQIRTFATIVRP
jgi:hypothetical protein